MDTYVTISRELVYFFVGRPSCVTVVVEAAVVWEVAWERVELIGDGVIEEFLVEEFGEVIDKVEPAAIGELVCNACAINFCRSRCM